MYKKGLCRRLRSKRKNKGKDITIPIYKTVDTDDIICRLVRDLGNGISNSECPTIHIDIAHEVGLPIIAVISLCTIVPLVSYYNPGNKRVYRDHGKSVIRSVYTVIFRCFYSG